MFTNETKLWEEFAVRSIDRILSFFGAALVLALMLLTVADVLGRNVFSKPIAAATELTEFGLVLLCFLTFPLAALHNRHIVADLLDDVRNLWIRRLQASLAPALTAFFFAILAWRMWLLGNRAGSYGDVSPILGMPLQPVMFVVAIMAGTAGLATIVFAVRAARGREVHP